MAAGDVAPVSVAIQVDVERSLTEHARSIAQSGAFVRRVIAFNHPAWAGHDCLARTVMPPSSGQGEVVSVHVTPVHCGGHGNGGDVRAQGSGCHAGDGSIGIKQGGQFAATCGRAGQGFRIAADAGKLPALPGRGQPGSGMRGQSIRSAPALAAR